MSHTNATPADVLNLLKTDLSASQIEPHLVFAQRFVADRLEGKGVPDATLTEIERRLGAWSVTVRDPSLKEAQRGDVRDVYQRDPEESEHLKMAMVLDSTGEVKAEFGDTRKVSFRVGAGYDDDLDLPASS